MSTHVATIPPAADEKESLSSPVIDLEVSKYLQTPRIGDRLLAALMMIPALPVIAVLVVIVRLTSRGPGIYSQVRVGKNGKPFKMHKIRTMVVDAEAGTGPTWAQENDPRITPIGIFLRRFHLDELPQLWNVIHGDMTIMGPRPERPKMVSMLAEQIPDYMNRLAVQPGITGLAQINLPPDTDLDSVRRKLILDFEYIREASFGLEFRMFIWTLMRLACVPASLATWVTGLVRRAELPAKSELKKDEGPLTIERILSFENNSSEDSRDDVLTSQSAVAR